MPLLLELQGLIATSLEMSGNTLNHASQYDVAINIAKHYAKCELSPELEATVAVDCDRSGTWWETWETRKTIAAPEYTLQMAEWAINEAREKKILRILKGFNLEPHDRRVMEVERLIGRLYNPNLENTAETHKKTIEDLKELLIHARLEHRNPEQYKVNKVAIKDAIDSYIANPATLEATKATLIANGIDDDTLDRSLTAFPILRTIETPELAHAKVLDEAAGVFHQVFAREAEILGGLQPIKFEGDEILYRGIDISNGDITRKDILERIGKLFMTILIISVRKVVETTN